MKIGLLGFGNVGQGIAAILNENASLLTKRTHLTFTIKKALVRNIEKSQGSVPLTTDANDILNDAEIDTIIEVIGGEEPALSYIKTALSSGKNVVTANKAVIAKHRTTLLELARKNKVQIRFEASVGGGIPILQALTMGYAANQIQSLYGILNGTTNYILTQMETEQKEYPQILKNAQKLGFAEADPTMDISGLDTAYKLIILAGVAFHTVINLDDLYYEGIENITLKDIHFAKELGYKIKLLAIGKIMQNQNSKMIFKVHPTLIPTSHALAGVNNEFNAVFVEGNAVGGSMMVGKGAGALPTGSAVVSDLIHIALNPNSEPDCASDTQAKLLSISQTSSQFYLRLTVEDILGTLEKITALLSQNKVSLAKLFQREKDKNTAEIVMITHLIQEEHMKNAIGELMKLPQIKEVPTLIRVGLDEAGY
jgi:homoserine dehydrogenase